MTPEEDREFLELVAFMLVSARNLTSEPPRYGPLRLVEAVRRLVEVLERRGAANAFLREVASTACDMPSSLMRSEKEFVESLDDLVAVVSARLAAVSRSQQENPP